MEILAADNVFYGALLLAAVLLLARVLWGARMRRRRGKPRLDEAEVVLMRADCHQLATALESCAAKARATAAEAGPDEPADFSSLEFTLPRRFQGDPAKLERLPEPVGPAAAHAVRKSQGLRDRLHDRNWEPLQRKSGVDTPTLFARLAKDFEMTAAHVRRVEALLVREGKGSITRLRADRLPTKRSLR